MKRAKLLSKALLASMLVLTACNNDAYDDYDSNIKNEYTKAWIKSFGLISATQDWTLVSAVDADICINSDVVKVSIYNDDPALGGHLIGRTSQATTTMTLDVAKGAEAVWTRIVRSNGAMTEGYYTISDGKVLIDGTSAMRRAASRAEGDTPKYAHTPSYFDAMIICEDLGNIGDYDFNDIVLGLKHVSGDSPTLTIVPMAAGGTLESNIYFADTHLGEIHNMIKEGTPYTTMLNTSTPSIGSVDRLNYVEIDLKASDMGDWSISNNWDDIKIKVTNAENTEIIFRPKAGTAPQMICLGGDWFWPREMTYIESAYGGFGSWSCDEKAMSWFGDCDINKVVMWNVTTQGEDDDEEEMWYSVRTTDNGNYTVRINGSTSAGEAAPGTYVVTTPWGSTKDMFAVYTATAETFVLDRDGNYILGKALLSNNISEVQFSDNFDMQYVTTMERMFAGCENLETLDLSGWDVSRVTDFFEMLVECKNLRSLNLDGWVLNDDADLSYMLQSTQNLTIKCSAAVEARMRDTANLGGTNITYTR